MANGIPSQTDLRSINFASIETCLDLRLEVVMRFYRIIANHAVRTEFDSKYYAPIQTESGRDGLSGTCLLWCEVLVIAQAHHVLEHWCSWRQMGKVHKMKNAKIVSLGKNVD